MAFFDDETKVFSGGRLSQIYHSDVPLGQVLLYQCLKYHDKVIQIFAEDGTKVTCNELSSSSKKFAFSLKTHFGMQFGDVVGFCGRNSKFSTPAIFGCILLGLPVSPVEVSFDIETIVKIFKNSKPKLVLCDVEHLDKIKKVVKILERKIKIVTLNGNDEFMVASMTNAHDSFEVPLKFDVPAEKICLAILPSSGTTGEPKLARISHAQALQSLYAFNGFTDNTLLLNFDGLFWISGFCCMIHCVLNQHTRLISEKEFSPETCDSLVEQFKVTQLTISPTRVTALVEHLNQHSGNLSSLKILSTGAWFISEETIKQIEGKMPNGKVETQYGMTEAAGIVSRSNINDPTSSSVGKVRPNVQAKILMKTGAYGGIGDVGEILLKIPFNIIDYLNDEKRTKELFDENSWIRTGDIGFFDGNLNLFISGREKFMIRSLNRVISPVYIEESIARIVGVESVCVTALPDSDCYEVPCAVIERKSKSNVTEKEIHEAVAHLEKVNHLRGGVFFVERLPKTPTGKLNRNLITQVAVSLSRNG